MTTGRPELPAPPLPAALGPNSSAPILGEGRGPSPGISGVRGPPLNAPLPLSSSEQSPREGREGWLLKNG